MGLVVRLSFVVDVDRQSYKVDPEKIVKAVAEQADRYIKEAKLLLKSAIKELEVLLSIDGVFLTLYTTLVVDVARASEKIRSATLLIEVFASILPADAGSKLIDAYRDEITKLYDLLYRAESLSEDYYHKRVRSLEEDLEKYKGYIYALLEDLKRRLK